MTLYEKIGSDIKDAMKSKNAEVLETLRLVSSELTNYEKTSPGNVLDDEVTLKILTKEYTKRIEGVKFYTSKGIEDGARKEQLEADIISKYLPVSATEEQMIAAVNGIIAISFTDKGLVPTVKDTGNIMKSLTKFFSNANLMFDRKHIASIISNILKTQTNG